MEPTPTTDDDASIEKRTIQTDVEIDAERWQAIEDAACHRIERDSSADPEAAFFDALYGRVAVVPNPIVDGEVKGIEDLACWSESDE